MEIDVKIMLKDDDGESFMGIGIIWLLQGIEQHHSISGAARAMGLSYPKALRIIRNLESGLGEQVVLRTKGGSKRGGAELTPLGRQFFLRFDKMQRRIRRFADEAFTKAFRKPLAALPK